MQLELPPDPGQGVASLRRALDREPHNFLAPSPNLHACSLSLAKSLLDPLAASRAWNRRSGLDAIHVDGFDVDQVWEQVSSLVDLVTAARANGEGPINPRKRKAGQMNGEA